MSNIQFIDSNFLCGSHVSKGNLLETIKFAVSSNSRCIQIFISSPQAFTTTYPNVSNSKEIKKIIEDNNYKVFIHASYTYNLNGSTYIDNIDLLDEMIKKAKTEKKKDELLRKKNNIFNNLEKTIKGLRLELDFSANVFGDTGVVVHIGTGMNKDKSINRIAETIDKILNGNKERKLLLENAAAEGNDIGSTLSELKDIYDLVQKKDQLFFCIDTCHLYAAGDYNIEQESEMKRFLNDFEKLIGKGKLRLIHLNDSMMSFGCKRDRHETLTKGYIFSSDEGIKSLKYLLHYCHYNNIHMVLETPRPEYRDKEIQMLMNFII